MNTTTFLLRSTTMNLMHEQLARAQCRHDRDAAQRARLVKALRAQRKAERLLVRAREAKARAASAVLANA
jgi:hypothetical protein